MAQRTVKEYTFNKIAHNDREFMEETTTNGFNIQLAQQPPNSPDMNVLDLGFFRSI